MKATMQSDISTITDRSAAGQREDRPQHAYPARRTRKIAIVTGLPAPYREPVFAELAQRAGIDLRVFYASTGHDDVGWSPQPTRREYDHLFLRNYMPARGRRLPLIGYLSLGLPSELRRFDPDYLIIYGYNQLSQLLAIEFALRRRVPFALRSDSNALLDTRVDWRSQLRRRLVRSIVRRAHGVLPVGRLNQLFWERLGARPSQIFSAPYAVNNEAIASTAASQTRDSLGPIRLLYVGRLLPRKGVDLLLHAFNRLVEEADVALTLVGEGLIRAELEQLSSAKARERITWRGKLANEDVLAELGRAELLVLPSRYEPWGLVVNEAMAAGLPVVAHANVGAAVDLIQPGVTGWLFDHLTADDLFHVLKSGVGDRDQLREMGHAAQDRIARWSIAATVDGMLAAMDDACPATPVRATKESVDA
jgi:glycosyltransferase involved in cell wall biosynthesis